MKSLPNSLERFSPECTACHGTGLYHHLQGWNDANKTGVVDVCDNCWGTGVVNNDLNRSVTQDIGQRELAQPGYTLPINQE